MRTALLGAGHIGQTIARLLHQAGDYDVVVIDRNAAALAKLASEGIATRVSFDYTYNIYKEHLDGFIQLTEDELAEGVRMALKTTHNLAEGAGAAAIAAAYKQRDIVAGRRVVCIMSGGNIDQAKLKWILGS